jgi:hypothetical protein
VNWKDGDSLEQLCPDCGRLEAAGGFCSGCYRRMGPTDWRKAELSDAQRAGLARLNERRSPSEKSRSAATVGLGL